MGKSRLADATVAVAQPDRRMDAQDRMIATWEAVEGWSVLRRHLAVLPRQGRYSGCAESWHCAMWQIGRQGGAVAVRIAREHGWHPGAALAACQQALLDGEPYMARYGDHAEINREAVARADAAAIREALRREHAEMCR